VSGAQKEYRMEKAAKDYLIFPLDVSSDAEARRYVGLLSEVVGMFKVGLELFIRSGPELIRFIRSSGPAGVFLDLKLHDIPATVSRAMAAVAELGARFATVHCGENPDMLQAAVCGSAGRVGVLAVTVLTSVTGNHLESAGFQEYFATDVSALVLHRARTAQAAGCVGVVCSGLEAAAIKRQFGSEFLAVTPGIRPTWSAGTLDDQRRITTPAQAVQGGSDYLVIGRPIRDAPDPRRAAVRIAEEIGALLLRGSRRV
jgi:orotidine-5'-phosphate decarboxylase